MQVRNNENTYSVNYGIVRKDVAQTFEETERARSLYSGFTLDLEFEEGALILEVDLGAGYEEVKTLHLKYIGGEPLTVQYNPHLASNMAEHIDILNAKHDYFFEKAADKSFRISETSPKAVAFYLPQFYPIPENDKTWGKGFTEWRNVTTAQPRFVGHQQPLLPSDLGYYDLRVDDVMRQQIELAKQHGIYGFCFYYYWFSSKKLLDKPLDTFLRHQDWDFNFMICWANENWTKRWDGLDQDVIIAQKYLTSDPLNFIKDVEDILLDRRYIRVDDKPVLAVYRTVDLKASEEYVKVWRQYFRKKHNLELHLVSVLSFDTKDPRQDGFDAAIEFVPQGVQFKAEVFPNKTPPKIDVKNKLLDINYNGTIFDYRAIVLDPAFHKPYDFPTYKCVMPSWDKDARKKGKDSATFHYSSPDLYAYWLGIAIGDQVKNKRPLVFINAWNEWAEGTTLEPSLHYGHAILNRTSEVLAQYDKNPSNKKDFPMYSIKRSPNTNLAVVIHVYYPEQWALLKDKLSALAVCSWDLYVTLTAKEAKFEQTIKKDFPNAHVTVVPNRGRDMLPFVHLARHLEQSGYNKILKLHTKKSIHLKNGDKWFEELVGNLLPGKAMVKKTLKLLDTSPAYIGPKGHYLSLAAYMGSNATDLSELLDRIYGKNNTDLEADSYGYFAGSMFWASIEVLKPVLDLYLMPEDFQGEKAHIDGTMAHAIERLFGIVAQNENIPSYTMSHWRLEKITPARASHNYKYV